MSCAFCFLVMFLNHSVSFSIICNCFTDTIFFFLFSSTITSSNSTNSLISFNNSFELSTYSSVRNLILLGGIRLSNKRPSWETLTSNNISNNALLYFVLNALSLNSGLILNIFFLPAFSACSYLSSSRNLLENSMSFILRSSASPNFEPPKKGFSLLSRTGVICKTTLSLFEYKARAHISSPPVSSFIKPVLIFLPVAGSSKHANLFICKFANSGFPPLTFSFKNISALPFLP